MSSLFRSLENIKESHSMLYYSIHFLTSWPINFMLALRHPSMFKELKRFGLNQLEMFGFKRELMKLPKQGILFELHSHTSNFSPDAKGDLDSVINLLFRKGIDIWALTDHNNSFGFDQIASGEYDLNKNRFGKKYELELNSDGRSLIITRKLDEKQLVLLRSIEYWTDMGEIGIYGYNTNLPNEGIHPYGIRGKDISLREAVDLGIEGGGFIVLNHPYDNDGIGWTKGDAGIGQAVETVNKNDKHKKFKINKSILKKPFKAVTSWKRKLINRNNYTKKFLREAITAAEEIGSQKRFIAIEKNVAQVFPKLYCPVKAGILAKKMDLPFVATGDAHTLKMYARSGVVFDEEDYDAMFDITGGNHADTVKALISSKKFKNYFNYPTYGQIIDWVRSI